MGQSSTNSTQIECPMISMVVIGRNEGDLLVRCFESIRAVDYPADRMELIYVDSNSTDESCEVARRANAVVIKIEEGPMSAARARNLGWRRATSDLVHFFDGDTILDRNWLHKAVACLQDTSIGCVFGRCEELRPTASVYMRVCNFDWHIPNGPWRTCGGIALFRRQLLRLLNGYCEELIAGEEPELCYRLRRLGFQIWRLDEPMIGHDLNMTRFDQYWQRAVRSGWAYCVVAVRCCRGPERLWIRENLVNAGEVAFWCLLVIAIVCSLSVWIFALSAVILLLRTAWISCKVRSRAESWISAILYAIHCQFSRIPFLLGQLKGLWYLLTHGPVRSNA